MMKTSEDFLYDLMDYLANSEAFILAVCEDCNLNGAPYNCPTDQDCFDKACPRHNTAWGFAKDITKVCRELGLCSGR